MGTIDTFAQRFGEGQRVTQFRVSGNIGGIGCSGVDQSFYVKSAQYPSSNIGIIEVPYRGRKIKMPGDRVFNEWTGSILLDQGNTMYDCMVGWMDWINSHSNVEALGISYKEDWEIQALDPFGSPNGAPVRLVGCWPAEVGTVDFNWETTDTIAEFSITLHFDYWMKDGATT